MGRGTSPFVFHLVLANYCVKVRLVFYPNKALFPLVPKTRCFRIFRSFVGFFHPCPADFEPTPSCFVAACSIFYIIRWSGGTATSTRRFHSEMHLFSSLSESLNWHFLLRLLYTVLFLLHFHNQTAGLHAASFAPRHLQLQDTGSMPVWNARIPR